MATIKKASIYAPDQPIGSPPSFRRRPKICVCMWEIPIAGMSGPERGNVYTCFFVISEYFGTSLGFMTGEVMMDLHGSFRMNSFEWLPQEHFPLSSSLGKTLIQSMLFYP